jgi:hypothetical protein
VGTQEHFIALNSVTFSWRRFVWVLLETGFQYFFFRFLGVASLDTVGSHPCEFLVSPRDTSLLHYRSTRIPRWHSAVGRLISSYINSGGLHDSPLSSLRGDDPDTYLPEPILHGPLCGRNRPICRVLGFFLTSRPPETFDYPTKLWLYTDDVVYWVLKGVSESVLNEG